jgi:hypothetical protein
MTRILMHPPLPVDQRQHNLGGFSCIRRRARPWCVSRSPLSTSFLQWERGVQAFRGRAVASNSAPHANNSSQCEAADVPRIRNRNVGQEWLQVQRRCWHSCDARGEEE